jgi:hypothetical protein
MKNKRTKEEKSFASLIFLFFLALFFCVMMVLMLSIGKTHAQQEVPLTGGDLLRKHAGIPPEQWEYKTYHTPPPMQRGQPRDKDGNLVPIGPMGPPLVNDNLTPGEANWQYNEVGLNNRDEIRRMMERDKVFEKEKAERAADPAKMQAWEAEMRKTIWGMVPRCSWPDK